MLNNKKNFVYSRSVVLAADGTPVYYPAAGQFFICTSATYEFELSLDGSTWVPWSAGLDFTWADGFSGIHFRATSGETTTLRYYAGLINIKDSRLSIIKDVSQSSLYMKDPPTFTIGDSTSLANGTGATIPGGYTGKQRRALRITNLSAAGQLTIQDADGNAAGAIAPGTWQEFLTSDTMKIQNDSGAAVSVAWLETYYSN